MDEKTLSKSDFSEIREIVRNAEGSNTTYRLGMTFAVIGIPFLVGLGISTSSNTGKLESAVQDIQPQIQTEDVRGQEASEKFYVLNQGRDTAYIEIDGMPISDYFAR